MCLTFEKRKRAYSTGQGYALLGFLPDRIAELEEVDGEIQVGERVPLHWHASADWVSPDDFIPQTF